MVNDELEQMAENIRRALVAVERAHAQGQVLAQEASEENLRRYQSELQRLFKELKTIDCFIHNEVEVALEDISELVHRAIEGRPGALAYRHTPKPEIERRPQKDG